jgi:hypothetical protein
VRERTRATISYIHGIVSPGGRSSIVGRIAWLLALGFTAGLVLYMFFFSPFYQLYDRLFDPGAAAAAELKPFGGDFLSEWVGGTIFRTDRSRLYDASHSAAVQHDPALVGFSWNENSLLYLFYPPVYYAVVSPLSLLSTANGALVWLGLMWATVLAAWALLHAESRRAVRTATLMLMAGFGPAVHSLNSGQKGTLWLLLFVAVGLLLSRQRSFLAGLVFGLLVLKPPLVFGIGAFMLLKRQWSFLGGAAVTGIALLLGSLLVGVDVCRSYLAMLTSAPDLTLMDGYPIAEENSWFGQMLSILRPLGLTSWAQPVCALLMLGSLCAALAVFRGPLDTARKDFLLRFSLLVLLVPLTSPKFQRYDLAIVLFPIWMVAAAIVGQLPAKFHSRLAIVGTLSYFLLIHSTNVMERVGIQPTPFICLGLLLAARPLVRTLYAEGPSPR